jgi:hypothetical protein
MEKTEKETTRVDALIDMMADVLPRLEAYRSKNVNKYHRESELEFREYSKMERYKNRVRQVDIILEPMKKFLTRVGRIPAVVEPDKPNID